MLLEIIIHFPIKDLIPNIVIFQNLFFQCSDAVHFIYKFNNSYTTAIYLCVMKTKSVILIDIHETLTSLSTSEFGMAANSFVID